MTDCNFCYEKERFPQIKKENEQLKSELETYQILAHKRGECYLSSLREIKKQKEEKEQLKAQIEKMKCCHSCKSHKLNNLKNCQTCDGNYSKWEFVE